MDTHERSIRSITYAIIIGFAIALCVHGCHKCEEQLKANQKEREYLTPNNKIY